MSAAAIGAAIAVVEELMKLIPQWIENARAKGELTPELEAKYQAHQAQVYAKPSAQPDEGTVEGTLAAAKQIIDSGVLDRVMRPSDPTKPNL